MSVSWSIVLLLANLVAFSLMLWRGEWPERLAVPLILVAILVEPLLYPVQIGTWRIGSGLANLGLFIGFWALSERADRWWLVFAGALQLIILFTSLMPLMTPEFTTHTGVATRFGLWIAVSLTLFAGVGEACAARRYAREGEPNDPRRNGSTV